MKSLAITMVDAAGVSPPVAPFGIADPSSTVTMAETDSNRRSDMYVYPLGMV